MARTVASSRTAASARSSSAARSNITSSRMPIELLDLGVTQMWDFRTGFDGTKQTLVVDVLGGGKSDLQFKGTTALSSVFTTGFYQADLEAGNSDYFRSSNVQLVDNTTALTLFAWIKLKNINVTRTILSQWETVGNRRGFSVRVNSSNKIDLLLSPTGGTLASYDTNDTLTDTSAWHFITAQYDTTNRAKFTIDLTVKANTLTSGTDPAGINSGANQIMVGGQIPSSPTNFFDGLVGICGIANTTSMTATQISTLYQITNSIGRYV